MFRGEDLPRRFSLQPFTGRVKFIFINQLFFSENMNQLVLDKEAVEAAGLMATEEEAAGGEGLWLWF